VGRAASAEQVRPPEAAAVASDVTVRPRAAGRGAVPLLAAAAVAPREAAAAAVAQLSEGPGALGAAEAVVAAAAQRDAAAGQQPAAAARGDGAAAVRRPEAEASDVRERRREALPLVVPWASRRDQALPWPAPPPVARFAHAMATQRDASP
jgi:hypothetical protein